MHLPNNHIESPPPLQASSSTSTSSGSSTPVTTDYTHSRRHSREVELLHSHVGHKQRPAYHFEDSLHSNDLFPTYDEDTELPLFSTALPSQSTATMSGTSSPINIPATPRQSSNSPRQSNLTSQFKRPIIIDVDAVEYHDLTEDQADAGASASGAGQESNGLLGSTPYGAQSIPVKNGQSTANGLSGSYMGGMSWGGLSMGSYIRDEIIMGGTSPYNAGSSSFQSSSYLPKMEARHMRNYQCCDIPLASMHDLLQHYEEEHASQPTQTMGRTPRDLQSPSRAQNAPNTAQTIQQTTQNQQQQNMFQTAYQQRPQFPSPMFNGQAADNIGLFGNIDDMDLDEGLPPFGRTARFAPQPHFGRQQPRGPAVNVNLANAFQGQGLNSATQTTPHTSQQVFQNNPTVSSVNTPTLGATSSMSQQTLTPDSSMPGTPAEGDFDYNAHMSSLNLDYNQLMQVNHDLKSLQQNGAGTINDPAKHLLSKQGHNKSFSNTTSQLSKQVKEQQILNGLAGPGGFVTEEVKPYKCAVIGCEKAYKNQNGLKYHRAHGHQNQELKQNADGSMSIVDPTTQVPYPGTMGMEKEKPYRCEVCGKRYKNLNGLKYHRQHSPPCNPELKAQSNLPTISGDLQSVNVAGAGLLGMDY